MNTEIKNQTSEFLSIIKSPDIKSKKLNYLIIMPSFALDNETQYYFPIGLGIVSSALKISGRNVFTLNLNYKNNIKQSIIETIVKNKIGVVLSGCLSAGFQKLYEIFRIAKEFNKNLVTIAGGGIITADPESAMQALEFVDYGVIAEGEITVNELAYFLENDKNISQVNGIIFKDGDKYITTEPRNEIANLDIIPFPDYEGFEYKELFEKEPLPHTYGVSKNCATVICSRSCPFNCTFCFHPSGSKYRQRSLDNLFGEIDYLIEKFGIDYIFFSDDLFISNKKFIYEFSERIKNYGIKYQCFGRVNNADKELFLLLKNSGCVSVSLGLESPNNAILKSMQKHITVEAWENAFHLANEVNLAVSSAIILGDLEETVDTVHSSVEWWVKNSKYNTVYIDWIRTFPGTYLYKIAVEKGIIKDKVQFLKNGCPQINVSKMSDKEYWEQVERLKDYMSKIEFGKLKEVRVQKIKNNSLKLLGKCSICGAMNEFETTMIFNKGIYCCENCKERLTFSAFEYTSKEIFDNNLKKLLKCGKIAIWAAVPNTISKLLNYSNAILEEKVFLINSNQSMQEICGKKNYAPNIILEKDIKAVVCPNRESIYNSIKKIYSLNYKFVPILPIVDLFFKKFHFKTKE